MNKWIAEFELEDGDTMPEHMDLQYKGGIIDFHCRPMWIPCSERLPEKYGWYQVTLKDGRVSRLYYDYKGDRWIDNVRKHMFELYDIYSKITHKRITEEKEDVYWDGWVVAWMPMPEPWKEDEDGRS